MLSQEAEKQYAMIIAKAWIDEKFKKEFLSNPKDVLKKYGIEVPPYVDVTVVDGSKRGKMELGLPPKPADIGDESIEMLLVQCSRGTTFC